MKDTLIISGFPGVGKSYFKNNNSKLTILDSDSSNFSWLKDKDGNNTKERNSEFPNNYIQHIKDNMGKVDIIFVSSHDIVRQALKDNNMFYYLVYPCRCIKDEYLQRYKDRGNNNSFIEFIDKNWEDFIKDIEKETFPKLILLRRGQHMRDAVALLREV